MSALCSSKPTKEQLRWQKAEFGMFCHFGINTFFGKEWSDGSLPASGFAPTDMNPRQWASVASQAGVRYMILTAKHHDGFCLWQTDTTRYSVKSSPWKSGKGDVVAETAEACRDAGIKFGLYLSPWDRNAGCYENPSAYDDFYCRQLHELCTRYGDLFELWFDGAGSEGRVYDWNRIMELAAELQPEAMIFNMGRPTIRWAGNEDGIIDDPVRYAVQSTRGSAFTPEFQDTLLAEPRYLPPECDVSIRQNWFWQGDDHKTLKSSEHLLGIWYRSVGMGANLLLNLPPDRRGLLDDADTERLVQTISEKDRRFAKPSEMELTRVAVGYEFQTESGFDHLEMIEDLENGQEIVRYHLVEMATNNILLSGHSVGIRRIEPLPATNPGRFLLKTFGSGTLKSVRCYKTGFSTRPSLGTKIDYSDWAKKADQPH